MIPNKNNIQILPSEYFRETIRCFVVGYKSLKYKSVFHKGSDINDLSSVSKIIK